ncbi:MAG TPA: FAD-dependent oxidoreductase [Flavitalea sp.]|nr:FAD-dependent oxidoreductase [Flavitalea sp.]
MIREKETNARKLFTVDINADLVIAGGGLSGVCGAITAARAGLKVILIQDRPVLGGNSSSEIRLWVLGATSHMGNNNRWAREGGVIDELLVENCYRNPEGNPLIFDTILLEKVVTEKNITLLLNTAVYELEKQYENEIASLTAFCSQNSTKYNLFAPLFCDASGDGIIGFLSGAAFRIGAESKDEFGEKFAPSKEYGELLGHSIYFYTKDTGKPVKFVPPAFALDDITKIPRYKSFNAREYGSKLWWIEYGGRLDTVHETETIKWELWKVVYGVWNYIKNSGHFPESETLTLEWVGSIPGKRESRRFEGDYLLKQQDIVEQRIHADAVAYGGWSIDLHPADGVFSEKPGCNQWHSKGIYQIPFRCLYSKNISNLFLAGRIISATHVAFGSSRVMATGAYTGQAIAHAAKICRQHGIKPKELLASGHISQLQLALQRDGHFIPAIHQKEEADLAQQAVLFASSEFKLQDIPANGDWEVLHESLAQMLPAQPGLLPSIRIGIKTISATTIEIELRKSSKPGNHTPDMLIATKTQYLVEGEEEVHLAFDYDVRDHEYLYLCVRKNDKASIRRSLQRMTGILCLFNTVNKAVSNNGYQHPTEDIGVDAFEFWCPKRRPDGQNIALQLSKALQAFSIENIRNGINRPVNQPNAWVADLKETRPSIGLQWQKEQSLKTVVVSFDTDFDHPMENVLILQPETIMPFCVQDYEIRNDKEEIIYQKKGNYQTRNVITFAKPIRTSQLKFTFSRAHENVPVAIFEIRCYQE